MMLASVAPWFDQELGPVLRIMVIDESPECARTLRDGLERAGHQVVASLSSTRDLLDQMDELAADVVMITTNSPSRDTLEHICVVSQDRPRPIVMFTGDTDPNTIQAAVRAGVTAYIVDGLEPQRIKPSSMSLSLASRSTTRLRQNLAAPRPKSPSARLSSGPGHPDEETAVG
jgi:two-component system, response regulator / RNA-binding antiterminator